MSDSVFLSTNDTEQILIKYENEKKYMKENAPVKENI